MTSIVSGMRPLWQGTSICPRCVSRLPYVPKRSITQKHLQKILEKELKWNEQADRIRKGEQQSFLSMLEERGLIKQIAGDRDALDDLLTRKRVAVYCGVDPTAPSMHIGHMLPIMILYWTYVHGFPTFHLLGGATAKVGDPSGRTTERVEQNRASRVTNITMMQDQMKKLWKKLEYYASRYGYNNKKPKEWLRGLYNNSAWHNKTTLVEVLRDLGKGMRVSSMLSRDSVKLRMESGDGISAAEFLYPLMQSWDWWELFQQRGVQVQIGGSDQFGNLVSGIEGVKYLQANARRPESMKIDASDSINDLFGITTPLLTTPSGQKLGKSEGNAVWLDPSLLSSFDLYQHFVRIPDAQVEQYLKWFTFLPIPDITIIMREHNKEPSKRLAQNLLGYEFVELVHGRDAADVSFEETKLRYPNTISPYEYLKDHIEVKMPNRAQMPPMREPKISIPDDVKRKEFSTFDAPQLNQYAKHITALSKQTQTIKLPESMIKESTWPHVIAAAGLTTSKSEAQKLMQQGGAYVHGKHGKNIGSEDEVKWVKIQTTTRGDAAQFVYDDVLMLRAGKWNIKFVRVIDDATWESEGLSTGLEEREAVAKAKREERRNLANSGWDIEQRRKEWNEQKKQGPKDALSGNGL